MRSSGQTSDQPATLTGRCLCSGVEFQLFGPFRTIIMCHCRQCAQWSGSQVAMTAVPLDRFVMNRGAELLRWYQSSGEAERGFCDTCGSSLFWRPADRSRISVAAGAIDPPTGLAIAHHNFVADKSDYYTINDGKPCHADTGDYSPLPPAE